MGGLMAHREVMPDGTIVVTGQIVPTGGAQPTVASVVSYEGSSGLQSTNVEGALDELDAEKAPTVHIHDDRYFTETEVNDLLAGKSSTGHTHDDRYFTEVEVTSLLAGKSDTSHIHDDRYYTETEIDNKLNAILASNNLHTNPLFDNVTLSTDGPGDLSVPARLYPSGWSNYWSSSADPQTVALEADNTVRKDNSGYSLRAELPHADSGCVISSSVWAVTPGAVVTVKAWVRGTGPFAFLTLLTSLPDSNPDFFGGSGVSTFDSAYVVPGTDWQEYTLSVVVPAGHTKARMMVRAYGKDYGGVPGTVWWDNTSSSMQVIPPSDVVTGEIKMWPTDTAPQGYLLCNGGTFSSDTYPALAALLGDTFGTHVGTSYYLPDLRGRSPVGVGAASPSDGSGYSFSMGQKFGTGKHTLTAGESGVPAHSHGVSDPGHQHHYYVGYAEIGTANWNLGSGSNNRATNLFAEWDSNFAYTGISIQNNGDQNASAAHNNTHPVLGLNFIIKAA